MLTNNVYNKVEDRIYYDVNCKFLLLLLLLLLRKLRNEFGNIIRNLTPTEKNYK